jgi:hypothetical protein
MCFVTRVSPSSGSAFRIQLVPFESELTNARFKIPDKELNDHAQNEPALRGDNATASLRSESGYESDDEDKDTLQEHTSGRRKQTGIMI